jgi:hypothetical protein
MTPDVAGAKWSEEASQLANGQEEQPERQQARAPPTSSKRGGSEMEFLFVGKDHRQRYDQETVRVVGHDSPMLDHGRENWRVDHGQKSEKAEGLPSKSAPGSHGIIVEIFE